MSLLYTVGMNTSISKSKVKPKVVVGVGLHKEEFGENDPLLKLKNTIVKYEYPFEPVGLDDWEALK